LLITLSKEYVAQVSLNVSYEELPQSQLLQTVPKEEIQIVAKGTGFKLLSTRFFNHSVRLKTNNLSKKGKEKYFFLASNQKIHIQKQLVSGLLLEAFLKDTVYLEIGNLVSKKVPVISNLKIDYHIGFDALKPIEIKPDTILVTGPENQIKSLQNLSFTPLFLENVSANFSEKVALLVPENLKNLKYNTHEIVVNGFVEKYTEGSFSVPFTVENLPENLKITTFPKEVKVVYKVDLPRFNRVKEGAFRIVCDYRVSEINGFSYLIPKIISKPNFVKNVKIIPNKVEYLIQK
tara:strand:- start:2480 stop:3352 length:873 start_codon:yes stop_codon:yes gene_type:complete